MSKVEELRQAEIKSSQIAKASHTVPNNIFQVFGTINLLHYLNKELKYVVKIVLHFCI